VKVRPSAVLGRVVVGGIVIALCWVIGLDLAMCLTLGLLTIGLYGMSLLAGGEEEVWRTEPDPERNAGARREVARLSWSLHGLEDRVDRRSAVRLHDIAAGRLAEGGLDLDSPEDESACRRILGDQAFATLWIDPSHLPRYAAFVAALGVVERLRNEEETAR
jgi:hypothetical protein